MRALVPGAIEIVPQVHGRMPYRQWDYSITVRGSGGPQQQAAVQQRSGGCSRGSIRLSVAIMIEPYLSVVADTGALSDPDASGDAGVEPGVTAVAAVELLLAVGLAVAVTLALDDGTGQLAS